VTTGLAVVVTVVSLAFGGSGVALLLRRTAVLAGSLMAATGVVGVAATVLGATDHDDAGSRLGVTAAMVLAPLALVAYPRLSWRHPVDFLAVVVVGGSGVIATTYGDGRDLDVIGIMGLVQGCVLIAHTWWRIERSQDRERRALVWMAFAVTVAGLVYFVMTFSAEGYDNNVLPILGTTALAIVGPAMYVGATLPDLVDVRGLVVTMVVTTFALLTVVSVFVIELSLLDALGATDVNTGVLGLLAAVAAFALHPARVVLRGVVDQLLFGERPDPLGAASAVAGLLGTQQSGADPVVALQAIREALVVPYAALEVAGVVDASSGTETTHTRAFDLDGLGRLVVGLRPGDLSFSPGDDQVLRLTVPLLAQTLRARALAAEVVESRGRTIAAVEEERRRLRRDLHDGLGPRLSGVAFTADAARNLIRTDPGTAEEMVAQLRADTVTAIEEIRRMVYAMRPPALDELGLVPALRQHAVGMRDRGGRPVVVTVTAPELPDLPAAVEVAAYRIVAEALANVARHSTSSAAAVRLAADAEALHVEVTDSGTSDPWRPGVGLSSMRERATELGGTLSAGPGAHGGTVTAVLPLRA
jgi:two-component system NarL family sensor kinase